MAATTSTPAPHRRTNRNMALAYIGAILLVVLGFLLAYQFVEPAPPKRLVMATGAEDGAYHVFGQRYRNILARDGITLELRPTAGSIENLDLLRAGTVDVALVQGGVVDPAVDDPDTTTLRGLASVFLEPLWLFVRADAPLVSPSLVPLDQTQAAGPSAPEPPLLRDLTGQRLAISPEGSGTRALATTLLALNGIDADNSTLSPLAASAAIEALQEGEIDVVFMVVAPQAPLVRETLAKPNIRLLPISRATAYSQRLDYLQAITLGRGVIDLAADRPPRDIALLATTASLVAPDDLHPALDYLLLGAAREIHRADRLLRGRDDLPGLKGLLFPPAQEAERFFRRGPPFLQAYLPFGLATLIDRTAVMLIPLITLLIPLARVLPPVLEWRMRRKTYQFYNRLADIDYRVHALSDTEDAGALRAELDELDEALREVSLPASHMNLAYAARQHLNLVRQRLNQRLARPNAEPRCPLAAAEDKVGRNQ